MLVIYNSEYKVYKYFTVVSKNSNNLRNSNFDLKYAFISGTKSGLCVNLYQKSDYCLQITTNENKDIPRTISTKRWMPL